MASIRAEVLMEGLQDMRVLQLLEKLTDRGYGYCPLWRMAWIHPLPSSGIRAKPPGCFLSGKNATGKLSGFFLSEIKLAGERPRGLFPFGRGEKQPLPAAQDNTKLPGQR